MDSHPKSEIKFGSYTLKANSEPQHVLLALIQRSISNNNPIEQNKKARWRKTSRKEITQLVNSTNA